VLIYFKRELQSKVISLFCQSLSPLGYMALGTKESLTFTDAASKFETVDNKNRIFRLNK
jgi:chemotaxis protein methyltransferase CheR